MRLTVGILVHRDERYLSRCLSTLVAQEDLGEIGKDWQIVVRDNGAPNKDYILEAQKQFPCVIFLHNLENAGYSIGHNDIMRKYPAEFHAVLNNDVLYEPQFLTRIVEALANNPTCGSSVGKLLRWNYGQNPEKTSMIDTVGIAATKSHCFLDLGQGEEDRGQYDSERKRFGGSGAAVVYRRSDLEFVEYKNHEFYDETMFMYKEDCDLAERLVAIGKPCLYVPEALGWHDRTASGTIGRCQRSQRERAGSAAHHTLIIRKHWQWFPWHVRVSIFARELCRWGYLLVSEPQTFFRAWHMIRSKNVESKDRRRQTKHTVPFAEVRSLFL